MIPSRRKHGLELSRDGSPCESRGVAPEGGRAPQADEFADCVHLSAWRAAAPDASAGGNVC